jgi:hypothetical protein
MTLPRPAAESKTVHTQQSSQDHLSPEAAAQLNALQFVIPKRAGIATGICCLQKADSLRLRLGQALADKVGPEGE